MRFAVKCLICGNVIWIRGTDEPDVNAAVLNDNDPNWGDACEHVAAGGDYEIGESQSDDDDHMDGWAE